MRIDKKALFVTLVLFFIPFFWLKPGFVDLGGDSGRLYFIDPLVSAFNLYTRQNFSWAPLYALIPYELFLYILKKFVISSTNLISVTRGLHLSLGFLSVFLILQEFFLLGKVTQKKFSSWIALVGGMVYIGFLSAAGWVASLETHYQGFLNPVMFYLLLRFCLRASFWYGLAFLVISLLYSGNFGFSAMPQLMSFYPLAILFLLLSIRFVFRIAIPWRKLLMLIIFFVGLHSFHLLPTVATLLNKTTTRHEQIFSTQSIAELGVHYFDVNHEALGKISTQLFQPTQWHTNILALLVPVVIVLAFILKPTKLSVLVGGFFATTLFLVSANISHLGVSLYRSLFHIPGFMMFRSFNDKWYYVYIFFYTLLFGISLYTILAKKKTITVVLVSLLCIGIIVYRMLPFLKGRAIDTPLYQSNNVSAMFEMDPDLLDTLSYIRMLPSEGRFLTLPLTFPYFQIAYGKQGGAYVGVSMILHLANRADYPGFWSMNAHAQPVFDAIGAQDWQKLLDHLSALNVRYVFYNSDARIMDNFPGYPYIYPGLMYSSKDQLPAIASQAAYTTFLASLPLKKIYGKGFYSVYEVQYAKPPVFTANFEVSENEMNYFFVGRVVSGITLGFLVLLGIGEFIRRRYENK